MYSDQGQFQKALEYYLQALALQKRYFGDQHPTVANTFNSMANVYNSQGDHQLALKYFQQSLAIKTLVLGENHNEVGMAYNNIATVHFNQKKYIESLSYLEKTLTIYKKVFGEKHNYVAEVYEVMGNVNIDMGRFAEGMMYHEQAAAIFQQEFGLIHPYLAESYQGIGRAHEKQGQLSQAIAYYQRSINAFLPQNNSKPYQSLESNSAEVLSSLTSLTQALKRRKAPGDDTTAMRIARFTDCYIDSLRRTYTYESDKLHIGEQAHTYYPVAIDVARWNKREEEAFYYSEKNKAAVLAQSLNEATALKLGGIPDSLLAIDKELRTKVAFYTQSIIEEELKCPGCDSTLRQEYQQELFRNRQIHLALKTSLESEFPHYYALKYQDSKINVKQIQQGFLAENPNSAILEYLLIDTVLFAFCITNDKYALHRQKLDTTRFKHTNSLQLAVKKMERSLGKATLAVESPQVLAQPASALYDYLIKPFEQQIKGKDLIIIPDGELNKIPFELLMKPSQNLKNITKWQELPYLIKQHNISYHYSAQLLLQDWQKNKTQPVKSSGFLAFAPVFIDSTTGQIVSNESSIEQSYLAYATRGDSVSRAFTNDGKYITPLPGTEREVKAIYELFNQKNQPAKYYLNDQANEATVKSINLKPYKYLHFATHGLTDEDRPTNSCLILAQNPDSTSDNLLTSSEMYGLELDAELVVLSACQTGKGTLKAGEGIIGLTRGLLYAGARNLLVSQWNVNDASTAELMTKFYAKVLAGQSNRQALREANLELLNSKFACPHYWSAFVLVGR